MIERNSIPEYSVALNEYKKHRNLTRKKLAKLKKIEKKYSFLQDIVEPRTSSSTRKDDIFLEHALQRLFESLNFKCTKPDELGDVDFRAKFKELYLGVEVKNRNLVGENDTFQPVKHKIKHDDTFHPILIYNNAKYQDKWGDDRIKYGKVAGFGLLLTSELKKGYLKLLSGKLDWEIFLEFLGKSGEIKFTNKEIERAKKSNATR